MSWPGHITDVGGIRRQLHHIIVNVPSRRTTRYFEMLGIRAIYHDGWVAVTIPATLPWELGTKTPPDVITGYNWELYNVASDPTESEDLAAKMPDKLREM